MPTDWPLDQHPAVQFLVLLGKDPARSYFRTLKPIPGKGSRPNVSRKGADLHGFDAAALEADNRAGSSIYVIIGDTDQATGKNKQTGKPTGAVEDDDVHTCRVVFVEWDDQTIEWQLTAWIELGLPEPTVMIITGGKSIHCYWVLCEPIAPDQWRVLQRRLIDYAKGDKECKNPSRLMRLPGFAYVNKKTGEITSNRAELVQQADVSYTAAEIEACLPAPVPAPTKPDAAAPSREFEPRSDAELKAALWKVPQFEHDQGRRNELFGLTQRLSMEWGLDRALRFMQEHSPTVNDLESYFSKLPDRINPGSIWPFLRDQYGYDLSRSKPKRQKNQQTAPTAQALDSSNRLAQAASSEPASLPASFQDLIQGLPDGWKDCKSRRISVGQMAQLIEGQKGELLRFNEMTMYVEAKTSNGWQVVNDAAMDSGYVLLDQKGWIIGLESVIKALCHVARQRSIHPVREYLLRIEQDQAIKPYDLDKVGPDMFRAVLPLHAAMVHKWLIGAAARVIRPGCQMDYCLVLHSSIQGMLKSSALTELASEDWHTSTIPKDDKDFLLNVHSKWIYELAELESVTNKRAAGELKNTITTRTDNFRVPYGRTAEQRKRASVFCGTVNTDSFLRDETGSRRYWVVPIKGDQKLNIDAIKKHRDSIWKAAVLAYRAGELPMLSDDMETQSERQNDGYKAPDAWLEMLQAWMGGWPLARFREEDPTPRTYVEGSTYTPADILYSAGLKRPDQITNHDATRLGPLLRSLGFNSKRMDVDGAKVRRWVKDHPETTRTTQDHPETTSGGPATSTATEQFSADRPPGPPEKTKSRKEQDGTEASEAEKSTARILLERSGGPALLPAETTSVCNGSERTTCLSNSGGPGGLSGGPGPVSDQNLPVWMPDLVALRTANPGQPPSVYANALMTALGITTDGRSVKAQLKAWDAQHPLATA